MVYKNSVVSRRSALKSLGALGAVGLAGCSGDGNNGGSTGGGNGISGSEMRFLTDQTTPAAKELQEKIASDFKSEEGVTVNIEYVGADTGSTQRISQLLQAGNPPEVFMANKGNAARYFTQDLLAPVTEAFEQVKNQAGEVKQHGPYKPNEDHYMVPLWSNYATQLYRSDLADVVPSSWEKALEYGRQAHSDNIDGIYVPAGTGGHSIWRLMTWLQSNNGKVSAMENGQVKIVFDEGQNRDRMIEVLEYIKRRYQHSSVATDSGWPTILSSIPNGLAASQWTFGLFGATSVYGTDKEFANDVKYEPMPAHREGATTAASVDGMIKFGGNANTAAADAWIKFFTKDKYLQQIYQNLQPINNAPLYSEVLESDEYNSFLESHPLPTEMAKSYINPENPQTRMGETDPTNPLGGIVYGTPPLWNMVSDVLVREKPIEAAIDEYAAELQQTVDDAAQ